MGPESPWGMALHYPNEYLIDRLYQGGVSWLRLGVSFAAQPGPGLPPAWGDALLNAQAAYQPPLPTQEVYLDIDPNYPPWVANGAPQPGKPASDAWNHRQDHWTAFLHLVLATFGGDGDLRVRYFHIGNEPNDNQGTFFHFGAAEYRSLLVTAARTIHQTLPGKYKVCAPEIATGSQHDPWDFLGACLQDLKTAGQWLDIVSIHGYPSWDQNIGDVKVRRHVIPGFIATLRPAMDVLRQYGITAPLWLTETGVGLNVSNPAEVAGPRVQELCRWIGEGMAPDGHPKFLKKIFFFVWSEDDDSAGKYAWLDWASLAPIPYLWDAYRQVTGESWPAKPRKLNAVLTEVPGQPIPKRLNPNEQRTVRIRATNTGTVTWTPQLGIGISPGSRLPQSVPPSGFFDFSVSLQAPSLSGSYTLHWQMVENGLAFGPRFPIVLHVN